VGDVTVDRRLAITLKGFARGIQGKSLMFSLMKTRINYLIIPCTLFAIGSSDYSNNL